MPKASRKNELRLFLSSTFRDLMPEREQLVKKTFPRVRAACRERSVEFTEIDLRWGITEEEARSGHTVRICLEEIDRCYPYFIGILGSRYGWVPGITEIEKDRELLKLFPWIREYAEEGRSMVEMEFAHGALRKPHESAYFYAQSTNVGTPNGSIFSPILREGGSSLAAGGSSLAEEGADRDREAAYLEVLRQKLATSGLPYRTFSNPEELGEQVFADILEILDRDFPMATEITPLEQERIEHEAFARNRRQSYVANPEYYEAFARHVEGTDSPLVIVGPSGFGKSALIAYLAHEYQSRNPGAFIIQHFIGSAEGSDPEDVMRQVILEIRERYDLPEEAPLDESRLREEFPLWLAKVGALQSQGNRTESEAAGFPGVTVAAGSPDLPVVIGSSEAPGHDRLILFIDALNQLTGVAQEMHWLPDFLPPNVRIVLSTTEGLPLEQIRKRKWKELELTPLSGLQIQTIASRFLAQYRKSLTFDQLALLSLDEKTQRPLFLRTLLEELRVFGYHESLDDRIEEYLESADERELFQRVLARIEEDHGAEPVRSVMTAIWASRHGLSENEIMEITALTRKKLSELMIALEYHLMQREHLHMFFHTYLREAVVERYLPMEEDRNRAHARLGDYFSKREFGPRRRSEEPWQWEKSQDHNRLKASLLEPEMIALLDNEHWRFEAFGYWRTLGSVAIGGSYISRLEHAGLAPGTAVKTFTNAIELLLLADQNFEALEFYHAGYPFVNVLETDSERRLWLRQLEILILNHLGRTDEVLSRTEAMLGDEAAMADYPSVKLDLLDQLAHALSGNNRFEEAERVMRSSIEASRNVIGVERSQLSLRLTSLATYLTMQGRYDEAEIYLEECLESVTARVGDDHPDAAFAHMQLASCRTLAGKLDGVESELERAEAIYLRFFGARHYFTCVCRMRLAEAKRYLNKIEEARSILTGVVEIMVDKYPNLKETAQWGITLGFTHYLSGDYAAAIPYYERYIPRLEELLGKDNPEVVMRRNRLAELRSKV